MKLQIELDKVSNTGNIQDKIKNKFNSLEKYLVHFQEDLKKGFIRVTKSDKLFYKVSFDLHLPGKTLFATDKRKNLLDALDEVKHKMSTELKKYVDKLKRK